MNITNTTAFNNQSIGLSKDTLIGIIGSFAMLCYFSLMIAPIPSLIEGWKKGDFKSLTKPYISSFCLTALLWTIYGYKESLFSVYFPNFINTCLQFTYLQLFLIINKEIELIKYSIAFFVSTIIIFFLFIPTWIIGIFASIINIFNNFFAITNLKLALETKSMEYINIQVSIAVIICTFSYFTYGVLLKDIPLILPQITGFFIFGTYIYLYFWINGIIDDKNFAVKALKTIFQVSETPNDIENKGKFIEFENK